MSHLKYSSVSPRTYFTFHFSQTVKRLDSYGFSCDPRKPVKWSEIQVMRAEEITFKQVFQRAKTFNCRVCPTYRGFLPEIIRYHVTLCMAEIQERPQFVCCDYVFVCERRDGESDQRATCLLV